MSKFLILDRFRHVHIPTCFTEDKKVSFAAKGLGLYVIGKIQMGEEVNVADIAARFRETESRINELLKELEENGYLDLSEGGEL